MCLQMVRKLGGLVTEIARECTHIVSPRVGLRTYWCFRSFMYLSFKVLRTVKFLSGISVCEHVVAPEWVEECARAEAFVGEFVICV